VAPPRPDKSCRMALATPGCLSARPADAQNAQFWGTNALAGNQPTCVQIGGYRVTRMIEAVTGCGEMPTQSASLDHEQLTVLRAVGVEPDGVAAARGGA